MPNDKRSEWIMLLGTIYKNIRVTLAICSPIKATKFLVMLTKHITVRVAFFKEDKSWVKQFLVIVTQWALAQWDWIQNRKKSTDWIADLVSSLKNADVGDTAYRFLSPLSLQILYSKFKLLFVTSRTGVHEDGEVPLPRIVE